MGVVGRSLSGAARALLEADDAVGDVHGVRVDRRHADRREVVREVAPRVELAVLGAVAAALLVGFNCTSDQMRVFRLNFLPAVPLLQALRSILLDSRLDVVVMSMGVWYNWDPAETIPAQPSLTRVSNTSMCEGEVLSDQERRACGRNGLNDYVADLRRLHGAVAQLRQESDESSFPVHSLSRQKWPAVAFRKLASTSSASRLPSANC